MTSSTLLAASLAALAAAGAYAYLALRLGRDGGGATEATILRSFALWWATLAVNMAGVGLANGLAAFGALPFEAQLVLGVLQRILLGVGVLALLRYLLYLRWGRDLLGALLIVYGAYVALALYGLLASEPSGVFVGDWRTELTYRATLPWTRALNLLVVLPSLVASLAYFTLYFKSDSAARRYRIAVVSWTLAGWWALAVVAGQPALLDVAWLQVLNRGASVLTAVMVLTAHHPPAALRAWLDRRERAPSGD